METSFQNDSVCISLGLKQYRASFRRDVVDTPAKVVTLGEKKLERSRSVSWHAICRGERPSTAYACSGRFDDAELMYTVSAQTSSIK
jgi:hypothetical protein